MPSIEITHAAKRYGAGAAALGDVSLRIEDGDFMCILGPSGCGKTTLLRLLAGLEALSDGEIRIGDTLVDAPRAGRFVPPEKRGIGLVFQSYALWPHMTVAQNIAFGLRLRGLDRRATAARVAEVAAMLRIDGLEARYPGQLSGGQQQRVALARMLAVNPGVLLLDEPLSNLDAALRLTMRAELARLHREFGTTIVFVTHDQWEAMTLANRIAVLSRGALEQLGSPAQVYDTPASRFVAEFIGNPPINMVATGSPLATALGAPDSAAAIGLRPEGMALSDQPLPGAIPVRLAAVLPTGGSWILELVHAGQEAERLNHATHVAPRWSPGTALWLTPDPAALHAFDAEGRRLPPALYPLSPASLSLARPERTFA